MKNLAKAQFRNLLISATLGCLCTVSLQAKEVPGKSVLYPYKEIKAYNFDQKSIGFKISDDVLTIEDEKIEIDDIEEMTLLRQSPLLRGSLIEVFDNKDLSFLSKVYLRLRVKREGNTLEDIFLTLDYSLSQEFQALALKDDVSHVDALEAKSVFVKRDLNDIYKLLTDMDKTFEQYPLSLDKSERKAFFEYLVKEVKNAIKKPFHSEENNSMQVFFNAIDDALVDIHGATYLYGSSARTFRNRNNRTRINRLRMEKSKENVWKLEKNLASRKLDTEMMEFRRRRFDDEFCSLAGEFKHSRCAQSTLGNKLVDTKVFHERVQAIKDNAQSVKNMIFNFKAFLKERKEKHPLYIHGNDQEQMDEFALNELALDDYILKTINLSRSQDNYLAIKNNLTRVRYGLWSAFFSALIDHSGYDEVRFYDEGEFYHRYPSFIFKNAMTSLINQRQMIQPFNYAESKTAELAEFSENAQILSVEAAKEAQKDFVATDLETFGTEMGEGLVNVLGQIFKKRKWVPYIRVATMFRESHMTKRREYVFSHLFGENGMKPGDIILEKDLKANTDVLIPGYWIHASMYLGTIKELKEMGFWDDPNFALIRYEIEQYQTSSDRQHYLNDEWGNKLAFEDIPWFYESDRPGVGVHPLIKFLYTDGMAVLRPTGDYGVEEIKKVYHRANERMYFPYDYVHNVRNKFYVSCSKVILKIYNDVTFPVTEYLSFMSVSPDEIGQPVSLDPNKQDEGELKLIMFFDAEDKGNLRYHYKDPATFDFYPKYLEFTGRL